MNKIVLSLVLVGVSFAGLKPFFEGLRDVDSGFCQDCNYLNDDISEQQRKIMEMYKEQDLILRQYQNEKETRDRKVNQEERDRDYAFQIQMDEHRRAEADRQKQRVFDEQLAELKRYQEEKRLKDRQSQEASDREYAIQSQLHQQQAFERERAQQRRLDEQVSLLQQYREQKDAKDRKRAQEDRDHQLALLMQQQEQDRVDRERLAAYPPSAPELPYIADYSGSVPDLEFVGYSEPGVSTGLVFGVDDECPICCEGDNSDLVVMICKNGHLSHKNCIKDWFRRDKSCPVCRSGDIYEV